MDKSMISSMNARSLILGIGINDADYPVRITETCGLDNNGKLKYRIIWTCPYYSKWLAMLTRCYSDTYKIKYPSYKGCSVVKEWHLFSNFRVWMETQDWSHKELDKDILVYKNKIYGPETCVFVDSQTNSFVRERDAARGEYPIGVSLDTESGKYLARCRSISQTKHSKTLGRFGTPEEAHSAWLAFKLEQAKILAERQTDPRVAQALINRYENYQDEA